MRWIAATLMGLLALSYALMQLTAPSTEVRPAPDDTGLGGLSILTETLRNSGYRVAFDKATKPRLGKDDIVVVPVLEEGSVPKAAFRHVSEGGRAFVIEVPKELQPIGGSITAMGVAGSEVKIDNTVPSKSKRPADHVASAAIWSADADSSDPVATLAQAGKGRIAHLYDGALATNRFLGRLENAKVVLTTLGAVAKPGERLVFVAGGYGEDEALGPFEAIGPWAVGALWQSLALLAAFGIARGIRFGLPAPEMQARRGARELLDTVASHYRRARRTDAALAVAARDHPGDPDAHTYAGRQKVPEDEARRVLIEIESRSKKH